MLSAKDESPRRLVTAFAAIKGAAMILTLLLWRVGVLSAVLYQDDNVGYYNTYGFCHRNVLAANITVLCLAWFYLRWRSLKIWDVAVWCAIALLTWPVAQSRTGLIILFLIIFGMFFGSRKRKQILKVPDLRRIVLLFFAVILLISVIGTLFYSDHSAVWKLIDSIFTKRFKFAHQCLEQYGLTLFGQQLPFVSTIEAQNSDAARLILDNSYMRALFILWADTRGHVSRHVFPRAGSVCAQKGCAAHDLPCGICGLRTFGELSSGCELSVSVAGCVEQIFLPDRARGTQGKKIRYEECRRKSRRRGGTENSASICRRYSPAF